MERDEPEDESDGPSPLDCLRELVRVRESFAALERSMVVAARKDGYSWRAIGAALGRSRQAAQQRFTEVDPRSRPPRAPDPFERHVAELARRLAREGVKLD